MAKGEGRGVKAYIPSIKLSVKILVALVGLRILLNATRVYLPASIQNFVPSF